MLVCPNGFAGQAQASISFVQQNFVESPNLTNYGKPFPFRSRKPRGNLNIVVVGCNDSTATVVSVNDTSGKYFIFLP